MNRVKKWFIKNELFADFSLAISILGVVVLIPFENDNVVPVIICVWLLISIIKDLKDKRGDED
jgi:hypothetical protein|tara:strand:+ start:3468 stop:3656 length:189 start_codon:yes stop_codon:yes gene_type:complete